MNTLTDCFIVKIASTVKMQQNSPWHITNFHDEFYWMMGSSSWNRYITGFQGN